MKNLTATLVDRNSHQRFYRLSHKLTKGYSVIRGKETDLLEELKMAKEIDFKPEYKDTCPLDGVQMICVSDAHTHTERLVFAAMEYQEGKIGRMRVQLDGVHTFSIYGGSDRAVKPDFVYLRRLAALNGLSFHYSDYQAALNEGGSNG